MRYMLMVLLLMMTACDALDWLPAAPAGTLLNDHSLIFSAERAREFTWAADYAVDNKLADEDGYWTPAATDIERLEAALNATDEVRDSVSGYYRQYFGFTVEGTQYIYGALFCQAFDFDWQRNLVMVMDGGTCFIDLAYNVATGQFDSLYVHGEA